MADRDSIIEPGDGGAASIVAGLLLVAMVVVGCLFFMGANHSGSKIFDIDVPVATGNGTAGGQ